jgi:hypothetical protein
LSKHITGTIITIRTVGTTVTIIIDTGIIATGAIGNDGKAGALSELISRQRTGHLIEINVGSTRFLTLSFK